MCNMTRWNATGSKYQEMVKKHYLGQRKELKQTLWPIVVKRRYLLRLKAKYAGQFALYKVTWHWFSRIMFFYRWSKDSY